MATETQASQLIREADWVLSKCGKPTAPKGMSAVYIPRSFLLQTLTQSSGQVRVEKQISGDTTWVLRAISFVGAAAYWQVLLPNGELLINSLEAAAEAQGFGSGRYLFTRELQCSPGSKIQVTFSNTSTPALALFEGADLYYVPKSAYDVEPLPVGSLAPKYLDHTNQNIMAPGWMHGVGPDIPAGYEDAPFTYVSPVSSGLSGVATAAFGSISIPIESGSDFVLRRLLFSPTQDAGVTGGTILIRIRAASGHVLNDDYVDLCRYIGSAPLAHDWWIKGGDALIAELQLVDYAGTGSLYMQVFADGAKRVKA